MAQTVLNKNQNSSAVWNSTNLVAGTNASITQVAQPLIDSNTLGVWHFDGNNNNAVSGSTIVVNPSSATGITTGYSELSYKFSESLQVASSGANYTDLLASDAYSTAGDFTIDFWARFNSVSIVSKISILGNNDFSGIGSNGSYFRIYVKSSEKTPSATPAGFNCTNWNHYALERSGTTLRWYIGGVVAYSTTKSDTAYAYMRIVPGNNNTIFLDELRISNNARYGGNAFTPNSQPYTSGNPIYQINTDFTGVSGYSSSGTQVLKNINGVLTWVME